MTPVVLRRIKELNVQGFRGFGHQPTTNIGEAVRINTDADIVLITGANGVGKTGLLQALQLLLSGHHDFIDGADLFSKQLEGNSDVERAPLHVEAVVQYSSKQKGAEGKQGRLRVDWSSPQAPQQFSMALDSGQKPPWPRPIQVAGISRGNEDANVRRQQELLARVTAFYPERVEEQFRSITTGNSLRDLFSPTPNAVREAIDDLKKGLERVREDQRRVHGWESTPEELQARRSAAEKALSSSWPPVREIAAILGRSERRAGADREGPPLRRLAATEVPTMELLSAAVQELRGGVPTELGAVSRALVDALAGALDREIEQARAQAKEYSERAGLLAEKQGLALVLERIEREFPRLDEELACFATERGDSERADLLTVFTSVAEESGRWLQRANGLAEEAQVKLRGVLKELEAVVPAVARLRALELAEWLEPRRAAELRRSQTRNQLQAVEREIERLRTSEQLQRLQSARAALADKTRHPFDSAYQDLIRAQLLEKRQRDIRSLEQELDATSRELTMTIDELETATRPSRSIHEAVREMATAVLSRFSLVDGILPLQVKDLEVSRGSSSDRTPLEPHTEITTDSGLALSQLSTGQRAQVAVSLAVAQCQLLRRSNVADLPYRVLMLDDVSTAYDISNLAREAVLWRQLAYHKDPGERWQLFISSHHEDTTNQLLDLLVPPAGAKLRLLRFVDWSQENGPKIEPYWLEPSPAVDNEAVRKAIAETFKEELCRAS
jgi:recombinational DNA repair ATPase RecF